MASKQEMRVEAMKQARKMLQLAMQSVELDPDDVAEISMFVDAWVPGAKYKKGMLASYDNAVWKCTGNVNKSETPPSEDVDHWSRADMAGDGIEVWTMPTGSGYMKGDKVHYPTASDPVYVSQKNNNYETPGTDEKYWIAE